MTTVFAVTMSAQMMTTVAMTVPSVLAPVVSFALHLSPEWLGSYVAIVYGSSMLSSLLMGGMVRRYGSVRVSQGGVFLVGAGMVCAATASPIGLLLSGALMGVGVATVTPAASNLILRFTPVEKLGTVFSIRQIGVPIGAGIAGAGVPVLLLVTGWQMVLLLIGAVLVFTALSFQPVRASFDDDRDRRAPVRPGSIMQPLRMVMSDPALRGISVGGFAFNMTQSGLLAYLVTYVMLELHYSLVTAGLILTASQVAAVFARMFWGWIADRLGDPLRILSLLGFISAAMCLVLGSITPQWPVELVVAVAFVFGATAVSWNGVYLGGLARFASRGQAATATSGSLFFAFFGSLLGPLLYSLILSVSGRYDTGFLLFAAVPFVAAWSIRSIRRRARQSTPAQRTDEARKPA